MKKRKEKREKDGHGVWKRKERIKEEIEEIERGDTEADSVTLLLSSSSAFPAISLGFTFLEAIFDYKTIFFIQP